MNLFFSWTSNSPDLKMHRVSLNALFAMGSRSKMIKQSRRERSESELSELIRELRNAARDSTNPAPNWNVITDLIYQRLKRSAIQIAGFQRGDPSFGPTALVNETFLKFAKLKRFSRIKDVEHFLALFARMMRQVFIDYQRRKMSWKYGGRIRCFTLEQNSQQLAAQAGDLVEFNDSLDTLAQRFPQAAQALEMQLFLKLEVSEIAAAINLPKRTVEKKLRLAKATMISIMET